MWRPALLLPVVLGSLAGQTPPPVVLVNGFDLNAATTGVCQLEPDSTGTFGRLQELLESDGRQVVFFDNCRFGSPSIEVLGQALGEELATIGEPVDLIGFSMGGLIIRSYLAGKVADAQGMFDPPADAGVRKVIFVATPHFGSPLASFAPQGLQGPEMREGSRFTWELARWHQGEDDLRELDALAIVGDGGFGRMGDGVVSVVSGSLTSFGREPDRTRLIAACHNEPAFVLCSARETMIAVDREEHPTAVIVRSFLADGQEWKTVGIPVNEHTLGTAGVYFAAADAGGALRLDLQAAIAAATEMPAAGQALEAGEAGIFFSPSLMGGGYLVTAQETGGASAPAVLSAGSTQTLLAKPGPAVARIVPAAGLLDTLSLAPDSLVSIYGSAFLGSADAYAASGLPLPTELGGVSVLAGGEPLELLFVSDQQINAYLRPGLSGLVRFVVRGPGGQSPVQVLMVDAAPAVFALNGAGSGPAAAIDAISGVVNSPAATASVGGFVSIYLTGLGDAPPVVTLGGVEQQVLYAGPAPGFVGLQQVNIEIVAGTPQGGAVELMVAAGGRPSNATTLAVTGGAADAAAGL